MPGVGESMLQSLVILYVEHALAKDEVRQNHQRIFRQKVPSIADYVQ